MKRWKSLRRLWEPFVNNRANVYSAGACFYMLLSMLPTILLVLLLMPYFPFTLDNLLLWVENLVPVPIFPFIEYAVELIEENRSIALMSFSTLTAVWAASRGVLSIMDGIHAVLGIPQKKTFLLRRLLSILYFLILIVCIVGLLLLYVFGTHIYEIIVHLWPSQIGWISTVFEFRYLYTVGLFIILTAMIYWLLPQRKIDLRWCITGGVITAVEWMLFSYVFSVYVNYVPNYGKIYGTLGTVILGGIWMYVCILVLLYSVQLCGLLQEKKYHPIQILKQTFSKQNVQS